MVYNNLQILNFLTSKVLIFFMQQSVCCGYGSKGTATASGYDCIIIPGASLVGGTMKPANQCGGYQGLQTASVSKQTSSKTICSE